MSVASFIKDYGSAIPWLLVTVGWFISNAQANRRELRKEVRSEISELENIVKDVGKELRSYYATAPASDLAHERALNIKMSMKALDSRFDRLYCHNLGEFPAEPPVEIQSVREQFFDAVTGEKFESAVRPVGQELATILAKQHSAGLKLIDGLYSALLKEFN
ncbi:hypothetical protein [Burkholderia guangdongensis]|uniref:hypothetical protein n=1 Tax=Burkholderia guangdongensis TaxID=1792500 RepID=UPI0015C7AE8B|nr:hypothetical protein [Burkholderia guangdongensis]